jgi:hypothetical protein
MMQPGCRLSARCLVPTNASGVSQDWMIIAGRRSNSLRIHFSYAYYITRGFSNYAGASFYILNKKHNGIERNIGTYSNSKRYAIGKAV